MWGAVKPGIGADNRAGWSKPLLAGMKSGVLVILGPCRGQSRIIFNAGKLSRVRHQAALLHCSPPAPVDKQNQTSMLTPTYKLIYAII